jgi:hypothetical protein
MSRLALFLCVCALTLTPCMAQQLELNDAGGSLTNAGTNPTPGTPFKVTAGSPVNFRVGGNPLVPFILLTGNLATTSLQIPLLNNQAIDLDLNGIIVLGDAIGFTGVMPFGYFFTGANGQSNWSFPTTPVFDGVTVAFQAITQDPAQAPFNLNITAACAYGITSDLDFTGDDAVQTFTIPSGAYNFYGALRSQIAVSTNGWVKFASTTNTDLSETPAEMISGMPGGAAPAAPIVAVDWEDLDLANTPAAHVTVHEDQPTRTITVQWINGEYFSTSPIWGTITLTISENSGFPIVLMDYTAYAPAVAPSEGIVGISDGNVAVVPGPDTQANLVSAGAVVPFGPNGTDFVTYFQSFDGAGSIAAEPIDVGGLIMTWTDVSGSGDWLVF